MTDLHCCRQKPTQNCKAISHQLKNKLKKNENVGLFSWLTIDNK